MDKNWLLNPTAVKAARHCIQIVEQELGVKLKLSHPDFIDLLYDYCELTGSDQLVKAFDSLMGMAGQEVQTALASNHPSTNVTPIKGEFTQTAGQPPADKKAAPAVVDPDEMIEYRGRTFKRWKDGLEFKGLYRGQARYA